jgi:hypothetical protein
MSVTFNMNKSKLVSDLLAELSALSSRVTNVSKGEFKLYGGTSWPIVGDMGKRGVNCIHGFNMSSLMMDVSRSYLKLHDLIIDLKHGKNNFSIVKKKLFVFILQTYASDRAISKFMKSEIKSDIIDVEHALMKTGWLSIPAGNHKKGSRVDVEMLDDLVIEEVAGHYWGSRLSNFNSVNHRYFAWPNSEDGSYRRALKLAQSALASTSDYKLYDRHMFIVERVCVA